MPKLIFIDLDHFKDVNDTYGHLVGDVVLKEVASLVTKTVGANADVCRWGGEEFLFAANESLDEVYQKIENLRSTISLHKFHAGNVPVHITLTFGIAEYADGKGVFEAINVADSRLYKGKAARRNCTVIQD